MSHLNPEWHGSDPASGTDLSTFDIRLMLTRPIPDGDIATLMQICQERASQIHDYGHHPDGDVNLPLHRLPRIACRYLDDAADYASLGRTDVAVPKLLKAGALILAAIARIRMEASEPQP